MVVCLIYMWTFFLRRSAGPSQAVRAALQTADARLGVELGIAVFIFILMSVIWLFESRKGAAMLAFTQADVHFLFPAPFTRRELIRYKVLRSQIGVLVTSALTTIFFRPARLAS